MSRCRPRRLKPKVDAISKRLFQMPGEGSRQALCRRRELADDLRRIQEGRPIRRPGPLDLQARLEVGATAAGAFRAWASVVSSLSC